MADLRNPFDLLDADENADLEQLAAAKAKVTPTPAAAAGKEAVKSPAGEGWRQQRCRDARVGCHSL
jgi:hypothetical protein